MQIRRQYFNGKDTDKEKQLLNELDICTFYVDI